MPGSTAFEGKPLVEWPWASDYNVMSGIGSIGSLASQAAQPLLAGQTAAVDTTAASGDVGVGSGGPGAASGNFSSDYAMSLLARITRASADQALALIQQMSVPVRPNRG